MFSNLSSLSFFAHAQYRNWTYNAVTVTWETERENRSLIFRFLRAITYQMVTRDSDPLECSLLVDIIWCRSGAVRPRTPTYSHTPG